MASSPKTLDTKAPTTDSSAMNPTQPTEALSGPPKTQEKIKTTLKGTPATALIALYGRHLESQLPPEGRLLNDTFATQIVSKIDYPFTQLKVGGGTVAYLGMRGSQLDGWVVDFIKRNPGPGGCTVVNLACGLDSRALRLASTFGSSSSGQEDVKVRWIDVDLPEVVELRREVVPCPSVSISPPANSAGDAEQSQGDSTKADSSEDNHAQAAAESTKAKEVSAEFEYTLLAGSATSPEFITSLPNDRPTMIVMEGLSAYLQPNEGPEMIRNLCSHFSKNSDGVGKNEMIFEAINHFTLALQSWLGYLKKTEAAVYWGISDARSLEGLHKGLTLVEEHPVCTLAGVRNSPLMGRVFWWLCSWFEVSRNSLRHLRYVS